MKWQIPGKTFLLGEYVSLIGKSALVITTTPCFELSLSLEKSEHSMHPNSPAGLWLQKNGVKDNLAWSDPYQGLGGLGASSAQFIGSYLTTSFLNNKIPSLDAMLKAYDNVAFSGLGLKPSAYDVIAQTQHGIVFIHKQKKIIESNVWPFQDLALFLLHTGSKLATHQYLHVTTLPSQIERLAAIVDEAYEAFKESNSQQFIDCINAYHKKLVELNRVAAHSLDLIKQLNALDEILAIKGCGALGADVLLIVCRECHKFALQKKLLSQPWAILATESSIYQDNNLIVKN